MRSDGREVWMNNLLATNGGTGTPQGVLGMVAELCETGWTRVTFETSPALQADLPAIDVLSEADTGDRDGSRHGDPQLGKREMESALAALQGLNWGAAAEHAQRAVTDQATIGPALYVLALCDALAGPTEDLAEITEFLERCSPLHPGPTALAGYAAFRARNDARGRKLMARAARRGRRAPEFQRTLKFVQKTLLEQHFGI